MRLIALFLFFVLISNTGCYYFYDKVGEPKRIPHPVPETLPAEIEGEIYRVWRGNELQIKLGEHTAYVLLQGVNNPDRDEATEKRAIEFMHSLLKTPTIQVIVHALDERNRMVGQVYCGDSHVNLEMIESGWGQYDGSDFDDAANYKAAEVRARAGTLGMWALEE